MHEEKYDFTGINFPTPLHEIKIFEKKNSNVSVNVYGLQKDFQPPRKYPTYKVYPLKVVKEEKEEHFDLLLLNNNEKTHYTYIANFSRLVSSQKTSRHGNLVLCKRCFTFVVRINPSCLYYLRKGMKLNLKNGGEQSDYPSQYMRILKPYFSKCARDWEYLPRRSIHIIS